ncbi:DNA-directed RNA polymerase, partial [Candidatus Woesearchaeota archaeon]|nr:DNA-directed RNA polymerase [Candidatus Woesearchaeota archaeon]
MFYEIKLNDHIRVAPDLFDLPTKTAVIKQIKKKYDGYISEELGTVIDVVDVDEIGEGIIVPGDGATFFDCDFRVIVFRPELQEIIP